MPHVGKVIGPTVLSTSEISYNCSVIYIQTENEINKYLKIIVVNMKRVGIDRESCGMWDFLSLINRMKKWFQEARYSRNSQVQKINIASYINSSYGKQKSMLHFLVSFSKILVHK